MNCSWKVKRGRPCKNHDQDCLGDKFKPRMRIPQSDAHFKYLQNQYLKFDFNQKIKNMILKFLEIFKSKIEYDIGLLILFEKSIQEMMVSKIEFAAFAVIFSKCDMKVIKLPIEELIKICIFYVKNKIDSRTGIINKIRAKLQLEIVEFTQKLAFYITGNDFTVREINKWLRKLSKASHITSVNYSYYINDILLISPPYKLPSYSLNPYKQNLKINKELKKMKDNQLSMEKS